MWGSAVGTTLISSGTHVFCMRVSQPVDDTFFVGILYGYSPYNAGPKKNMEAVVWSGGSTQSERPGTIRLHSEKMKNQLSFSDGDVLGVVVDCERGNLEF